MLHLSAEQVRLAEFANHVDAVRRKVPNAIEWVILPFKVTRTGERWHITALVRIYSGPTSSSLYWVDFFEEGKPRWVVRSESTSAVCNRWTGLFSGWKRDEQGILRPEKQKVSDGVR